jgi:DNA modification methylase
MTLLSGNFTRTPINRSEIPQVLLDIEDKQRSSPFPWKGQFSPQFVEVLLKTYSNANTVLLDPFLGSGTVLYEAVRFGLEAYGTEINPAAYTLASIYKFTNVSTVSREKYINTFLSRLKSNVPESSPIFRNQQEAQEASKEGHIKQKIVELALYSENGFVRTLHEALIVLLDFYNKAVTGVRVFATADAITRFVRNLPFSKKCVTAFNADARRVPLKNGSVNLVITSPPYINVFNYHQQYRASTEALSWNLLQVAKSEFGSNRKHRGNRFLTVIQYCLDMASTFEELIRLCEDGSRMIFVVGKESNVRGTALFNGELVAEVAYRVFGLKLELRQERSFVNRYGKSIKEDILHFISCPPVMSRLQIEKARSVAVEALGEACKGVTQEVRGDIEDAIYKAETVKVSPYYDSELSRQEQWKEKLHV